MSIVVLMGESGVLEKSADVAIKVPCRSTQHIQETHLAIEHVICHLVERQMYSGTESPR
jgi:D-sedoheptulose 7-phosphate isomerase